MGLAGTQDPFDVIYIVNLNCEKYINDKSKLVLKRGTHQVR